MVDSIVTGFKYNSGSNDLGDLQFIPREVFLRNNLAAWGSNSYGTVGDNTMTNRSYPVIPLVSEAIVWKDISISYQHWVALATDGTLWSCGSNSNGCLGDGTILGRSSPVQCMIGTTGPGWKQASAGNSFTLAIRLDGTLWGLGSNSTGQLASGDTTAVSSPVQVGAGTDWKQVSTGNYHASALKTNGSLWTWGHNNYGQLGDGTRTWRSSPVQVGAGTDWKQVSCGIDHVIALKTTGTLWAWGSNLWGQLGDGTRTYRSSPIQIGAGTDWYKLVDIGGGNHSGAIKTEGSLWVCGYNSSGDLGDGTKTNRSSPVQIGTDKGWRSVTLGNNIYCIRNDGTLWVSGPSNTTYPLTGNGGTTTLSSLTQVGGLTNWRKIASGYTTLAIQNNF